MKFALLLIVLVAFVALATAAPFPFPDKPQQGPNEGKTKAPVPRETLTGAESIYPVYPLYYYYGYPTVYLSYFG